MSEERRQILNMLAEGKISADDADRLLARLEQVRPAGDAGAAGGASDSGGSGAVGGRAPGAGAGAGSGGGRSPRAGALKYLRVLVDSADGDKVNVRVPLALVRTGIKLSALLPANATRRLDQEGIDLSHLADLGGDEMIEALRELDVDVTTLQGDSVRVFCE